MTNSRKLKRQSPYYNESPERPSIAVELLIRVVSEACNFLMIPNHRPRLREVLANQLEMQLFGISALRNISLDYRGVQWFYRADAIFSDIAASSRRFRREFRAYVGA